MTLEWQESDPAFCSACLANMSKRKCWSVKTSVSLLSALTPSIFLLPTPFLLPPVLRKNRLFHCGSLSTSALSHFCPLKKWHCWGVVQKRRWAWPCTSVIKLGGMLGNVTAFWSGHKGSLHFGMLIYFFSIHLCVWKSSETLQVSFLSMSGRNKLVKLVIWSYRPFLLCSDQRLQIRSSTSSKFSTSDQRVNPTSTFMLFIPAPFL